MPKSQTPTAVELNRAALAASRRVIAASRRVIAARANPKLDWGQTRATEELSFALDELTQATQAYDKAMGIESPVAPETV